MARRHPPNAREACASQNSIPSVQVVVLSSFPSRRQGDDAALASHRSIQVSGEQIVVVGGVENRQAPADQRAELKSQPDVLRGRESVEALDALESHVAEAPQRVDPSVSSSGMSREQRIVVEPGKGRGREKWRVLLLRERDTEQAQPSRQADAHNRTEGEELPLEREWDSLRIRTPELEELANATGRSAPRETLLIGEKRVREIRRPVLHVVITAGVRGGEDVVPAEKLVVGALDRVRVA